MLLLLLIVCVLVVIVNSISIPVKPISKLPGTTSSDYSNNDGGSNGGGGNGNEATGSDSGSGGGGGGNDDGLSDNNADDDSNGSNGGGGTTPNSSTGEELNPTNIPTKAPFTFSSFSPTIVQSTYTNIVPTTSPTYTAGSPTPIPTKVPTYVAGTISPTYTAGSPTPIPTIVPTYVAGLPTPVPSLASKRTISPTDSLIAQLDDNIKDSAQDTNNIITTICKRDNTEWIKLYLSKTYKRWLIALISLWFTIFTYAFFNIYMLYSLQQTRYGSMTLNSFRYGLVALAASMRIIELSIITTLKTTSATCFEFSFTKSNDSFNYNSFLVPFIILTHELLYPIVLIVVVLRHKLIWIQFKRITDSHTSKNAITLSVENYGILIGVIFILMDIISFAGPVQALNSYSIATQIICPLLSLALTVYKYYEFNPFDVRSQIEHSKWGQVTPRGFDRIIAINLALFSVFAIITTRAFLFKNPLASMVTYSIMTRVLEVSTVLFLSFNTVGTIVPSLRHEHLPKRVSIADEDGDDDESSLAIFVNNDSLQSEIDVVAKKSSKKSMLSSKSHRSISYTPKVEISGSVTQFSSKKSVQSSTSKKSSSQSHYSALYSTSLMQSTGDSRDSQQSIRL